MPTYEYHCAANGQLVEARHNIAERLATWERACAAPGCGNGFCGTGACS